MGRRGGYRGIFEEVITDLEFDDHKSVKKCIFRTLEQAGTNICSMGCQNSNFKIGLSLFSGAQNYTEQSTHCAMEVRHIRNTHEVCFGSILMVLGTCI